MKNTLIVEAESMTSYFQENMMEHIYHVHQELPPHEFCDELDLFSNHLKRMSSMSTGVALECFRERFGEGCTMMMLGSKDFEQLEKWADASEPFQVAIFWKNGDPVGLVSMEYLNW